MGHFWRSCEDMIWAVVDFSNLMICVRIMNFGNLCRIFYMIARIFSFKIWKLEKKLSLSLLCFNFKFTSREVCKSAFWSIWVQIIIIKVDIFFKNWTLFLFIFSFKIKKKNQIFSDNKEKKVWHILKSKQKIWGKTWSPKQK